jgi:hypothetical protein
MSWWVPEGIYGAFGVPGMETLRRTRRPKPASRRRHQLRAAVVTSDAAAAYALDAELVPSWWPTCGVSYCGEPLDPFGFLRRRVS